LPSVRTTNARPSHWAIGVEHLAPFHQIARAAVLRDQLRHAVAALPAGEKGSPADPEFSRVCARLCLVLCDNFCPVVSTAGKQLVTRSWTANVRRETHEHADAPHALVLLRAGSERPRDHRA
jgi:hypothetical protein